MFLFISCACFECFHVSAYTYAYTHTTTRKACLRTPPLPSPSPSPPLSSHLHSPPLPLPTPADFPPPLPPASRLHEPVSLSAVSSFGSVPPVKGFYFVAVSFWVVVIFVIVWVSNFFARICFLYFCFFPFLIPFLIPFFFPQRKNQKYWKTKTENML